MRYFWLRDKHNAPVACVATDKKRAMEYSQGNTEGMDLGYDVIVCTVSTRNPIDPFVRKHGRWMAVGKLALNEYDIVLELNETSSIKRDIMYAIAHGAFPTRARNAARFWLRKRKEAQSNSMTDSVVTENSGDMIATVELDHAVQQVVEKIEELEAKG